MKRRIIYIVAMFAALSFFSAYNDKWKDEPYSHMISLKAPIGGKEVSDVYVRYKPDGEIVYDLPVLISRSTPLDRDLSVCIIVDPDTLVVLNLANYHGLRKGLWCELLPEQNYEFTVPTCYMPAGIRKELLSIKFKFSGLNLSKKWVLPLTVEEDPSYVINKQKGWRKVLLHVLPYNNYSGNYSTAAMNVCFAGSNDDPLVIDNRRAYIVDESAISFYAGMKEDSLIDQETHRINVKSEKPIEETEIKKTGNPAITATNLATNPRIIDSPTYEIWGKMDVNQPYLLYRYHVLGIEYSYDDVTSSNVLTLYRASGSLLMEQKVNALIPDQDQAIQW